MVTIRHIRTQRINLKLRRPLRMSFGEIADQHVLLVRTTDADGFEGVGEACVMGGPYWNADTIEGTRATVERYAAPFLLGHTFADLESYSGALHRLFRGNGPTRTALEMSFLDLAGKKSGQPAVELLGGARRTCIPVGWTLNSDSLPEAIAEGERALEERGHRLFKLKVGIYDTEAEIAYVRAIARHFEGRARVLIDANQAWRVDEAIGILGRFHEAGVAVAEQPIPGHDAQAMARLARESRIPVLADEALTGPPVAALLSSSKAAAGFALKPQRDGGLLDTMATAATAAAAGLSCYGGTMLETSLGTAALAALYASVADLSWGSELFGPLRLNADITTEPFVPRNGHLELPTGPGLGVVLDEDRIRYLERAAEETI
jgi:muconate cycloisomerase